MLMKSKFIVAEYYHTRLAGNDVWRATPLGRNYKRCLIPLAGHGKTADRLLARKSIIRPARRSFIFECLRPTAWAVWCPVYHQKTSRVSIEKTPCFEIKKHWPTYVSSYDCNAPAPGWCGFEHYKKLAWSREPSDNTCLC
jgi:hypothetical protein